MEGVPAAHAFEHIPQLEGSEDISTQAPSHAVKPDEQLLQTPLRHASVPMQLCSHVPQLWGSEETSVQRSEQSINPVGHTQVPLWHVAFDAQA
jgi:hypothetical protein